MSEKPMIGEWKLVAPNGAEYKAESPLKCCKAEINERIPVELQLENIHRALYGVCDLCGDEFSEGEKKYSVGDKECPGYLNPLCGACAGTIIKTPVDPQLLPLAKKHTQMRVDYSGLFNRIAGGCKVRQDQRYMLGEMGKHLQNMADRFYSGEITVVDEFLQLYCLDEKRPE